LTSNNNRDKVKELEGIQMDTKPDKKAADYLNQWNSQRAAERLETFVEVAEIITLIVFVLVMIYP
jgi:hypothetical protein